MGWLSRLFNADYSKSSPRTTFGGQPTVEDPKPDEESATGDARSSAYNRLKLVLMHDRTQLSPQTMESMRDELVAVISKYVEIDQRALELSLESESNTIALVANIPILRSRAG